MRSSDLFVRVHPAVAEVLNERFYLLRDMEEELSCRITVQPDQTLHPEKFDITEA